MQIYKINITKVLEILKSLIAKVDKEPGVLQYDCFVEEKTGDVVFVEKYVNLI